MATLQELVKYLQAGLPLQSSKGEVLRLLPDGQIGYARLQDYHFEHEVMSQDEAHALRDDTTEEWGVLFCRNSIPWRVEDLAQIETLVAHGVPGYDGGQP